MILLHLEFEQPVDISTAEIKAIYAKHGPELDDPLVQTSGERELLIRSKNLSFETKNAIEEDIRQLYGDFRELRFESVGPAVGAQITCQASQAAAFSALGILF